MATQPILFMFSGQGSHYYQMGLELFQQDAAFRDALQSLDAVAAQELQASVLETLYAQQHRKADTFDRTLFTHPAIYMVQCAMVQSLAARGIHPDYVLGASLGMYVAAAVAGVYSMEEGLRFVIRQARTIEACCPPGAMLAVLASPDVYDNNAVLRTRTELAGVNFATHFVVSGTVDAIHSSERSLQAAGILCQRLAVSHAFHSKQIDAAEQPLRAALGALSLQRPQLSLVCCMQARRVEVLSADLLWPIARAPIRFRDTLAYLERLGSWHYIDAGPAGTLAGFTRSNLAKGSASKVTSIMSAFGQDTRNLLKLCA